MIKLKNKIPDFITCLILGTALGIISKYLDTIPVVDGGWWTDILRYFWKFIYKVRYLDIDCYIYTPAYSKTLIKAAINTFIFFTGMLISYYSTFAP